jgi:hypothetical protein
MMKTLEKESRITCTIIERMSMMCRYARGQ